jgi:phage terminase small subunit
MAAKKKEVVESAFDKLSDKHKLFVLAYCGECLFNATRAYQKAYDVQYQSAVVNGSKLLTNANVKKAIEEVSAQQFAEMRTDKAKNETYQKIKALSQISIEEVCDLAGRTLIVKSLDEIPAHARYCIRSIKYDRKETEGNINENIHVTFEDKLKALELLSKVQGLLEKEDNTQKLEIIVKPAIRPEE